MDDLLPENSYHLTTPKAAGHKRLSRHQPVISDNQWSSLADQIINGVAWNMRSSRKQPCIRDNPVSSQAE